MTDTPRRRNRTLPLEAHDTRIFDLWRRGALEVIVLGEVTAEAIVDPAYYQQTARLARLNQIMNSARSTAKRVKMPGWEELYRSVIRCKRDKHGRTVKLTMEPRGSELDTLLGDRPLVTELPRPESPALTEVRTGEAPPDDILADLFGPPITASGEGGRDEEK